MLSEAIDVLEISCSFQGVTVLILMSATIPSTRKKTSTQPHHNQKLSTKNHHMLLSPLQFLFTNYRYYPFCPTSKHTPNSPQHPLTTQHLTTPQPTVDTPDSSHTPNTPSSSRNPSEGLDGRCNMWVCSRGRGSIGFVCYCYCYFFSIER